MQLQEDISNSTYQINSVETGKVIINQTVYDKSFILFPDKLLSPWPLDEISQITEESLSPVLNEAALEVVIVGADNQLPILPTKILEKCYEKKISIEVMNNRSACYTFTILAGEGRKVALCLILGGLQK